MATNSPIEWTDHTFNPWVGCAKISPACTNCYAEVGTLARVHRSRGRELWGPHADRHVTSKANWRKPLSWARKAKQEGIRRRVFCASWADVFEDRPDLETTRERLFKLIEATPGLDWQLLTKRPERILQTIPEAWRKIPPPPNVWYGATVENTDYTWRIDELRKVPATVRFLSVEPMLGPLHDLDLTDIRWVICGGESGLDSRPMNIEWARDLRDQCKAAKVPFFFKQWGQHDHTGKRCRSKKVAGRMLDGRTWDEFPYANLFRYFSVGSRDPSS